MTSIKKSYIPTRLKSALIEHPYVCGTEDIIDDDLMLTQAEINDIVLGGALNVSLTSNKSAVFVNENTDITLIATMSVKADRIVIKMGQTQIGTEEVNKSSCQRTDNVTPTGNLTYTAYFTKGGKTKETSRNTQKPFLRVKTHGNISSLASCPNIVTITLANCPLVEGNIASIANKLKLSDLFIYLTAITGSIEDLVAGQIEQGVVTGTINSRGLASQLTFGGSIQTNDKSSPAVLYWNTASKIYFGLGDRADINSCTTIYAKGATTEEISAWENAGKTVNVIS